MAAVALLAALVNIVQYRQSAWCSAATPRRNAAAAAASAAIAAAVGAPDAASAKKKKKKEEQFTLSYLPPPNISGVVYPDYDNPPAPDPDPVIRMLQKKSWEQQPNIRIMEWLQGEMRNNDTLSSVFGFSPKYPVRYASDSSRFDIIDKASFDEATSLGKILEDKALDFPNEEFKCWMYAAAKDEEWSKRNIKAVAELQMPDKLIKKVERIKSLKFGE